MRRLLLGVVACAVLVACGGDDDPAPATTTSTIATTTTTLPATTTTEPESGYLKAKVDPSLPRQDIDVDVRYPAEFTPEQVEVVTVWANYRHAGYVVVDPPDPTSPLIGRYAAEEVAEVNRVGIERRVREGTFTRLPLNSLLHETITDVTIDDTTASLTTCQVDDAVVLRSVDGSVVNDDVVTKTRREFLTKGTDGWRVSPPRPDRHEKWPGVQEERCLP